MKYTLRKIFIGVSIGFILMCLKSCNVYAFAQLGNTSRWKTEIYTSFDYCSNDNDNLTCKNGFNYNFIYEPGVYFDVIPLEENNFFALKSFSLVSENINDTFLLDKNNINFRWNIRNIIPNWLSEYNNLYINQYPLSAQITTTDGTVCDVQNLGIYLNSNYTHATPNLFIPSNCKNKYLKKLVVNWQNGFNYKGSLGGLAYHLDYGSNYKYYWTNYKSNNYLGLFKKTSKYPTMQFYGGDYSNLNIEVINNNSSNYMSQDISSSQQELQNNIAEQQKQEDLISSWIDSDLWDTQEWTSSQNSEMEETFGNVSTGLNSALDDFAFNDFLSALTQYPIEKMLSITRDENIAAEGSMEVIKCPTIYLPFKVNLQTAESTYGMNLPCMSSIYEKIPFVGGGNEQSNPWNFNLIVLWHIILHGYLTYLLILTWLNLIKYSVTRSSSEIEVLEL